MKLLQVATSFSASLLDVKFGDSRFISIPDRKALKALQSSQEKCPEYWSISCYKTIEIAFDREKNIKELHFGVTANLFTFKDIMNSVRDFNGVIKSGGDRG